MNKKTFLSRGLVKFCFLFFIFFLITTKAYGFSDVDTETKYYSSIMDLYNRGIINGYEDGTFKPNNNITRGEVAAIIANAFNYTDQSVRVEFVDLPVDSWAFPHVMKVYNAGIMKGVGNNRFDPNAKITNNEIMKMAVSLIGHDDIAEAKGGWPVGYERTGRAFGISYNYIYANDEATRADVCEVIYKIMNFEENNKDKKIILANRELEIGMKLEEIGIADEIVASIWKGTDWYFYNTDDYNNFYGALVKSNIVLGFASAGYGFEYLGHRAGEHLGEDILKTSLIDNHAFYLDSNDDKRIHGVLLDQLLRYEEKQFDDLSGESRLIFHLTNAFRVFHGRNPLLWEERVAEAARLHSQDMADNNYFGHEGLDGRRPSDRVRDQGIAIGAGENISGGPSNGFSAYNSWVNSQGHRTNMLGESHYYLGVGMAYNKDSRYKFYSTQNFTRDYDSLPDCIFRDKDSLPDLYYYKWEIFE